MKKHLLLLGFTGINFLTYSQLTVDNTTLTPAQLVQQVLVGTGVTVSNVTFNGSPANTINMQVGSFGGSASNIGLNSGVIMGSGNVQVALGPNNSGGASMGLGGILGSDPDLQAITPNQINDEAILEFDFIPVGDTISFRYVFASEEYNEYVCATVNDAFGFFISGPGITGPYTNNAKNIALVPGTSTAVSIGTVNLGVPGANGTAANCNALDPNWASYNIYYNGTNTQQTVEYDGWTKVLTATSAVQCGQTYHIKLAIGDAGDGAWDSGVFLEEGSLNSYGNDVLLTTVNGGNAITEGCPLAATFIFIRPDTAGNYTMYYDIGGNAVNGADYNQIPDSIIIPAGFQLNVLTITPINDGITEGVDTMTITVYSINACGDTIPKTATMLIQDPVPLVADAGADQLGCVGAYTVVDGGQTGGDTPFSYNWSFGSTNEVDSLQPGMTQDVILTVSDWCGQSDTDTMTITVPPVDVAFVTLDVDSITELCVGTANFIFTRPTSTTNYNVTYTITGTATNGTDYVTMNNTVNFPIGVDTVIVPFTPIVDAVNDNGETVTVTITNNGPCGIVISTITLIIFEPQPFSVSVGNNQQSVCPGQTITVNGVTNGGLAPYSYQWNSGPTTPSISVQPTTPQTYILTVTDVCGFVDSDTMLVTIVAYLPMNISVNSPTIVCAGNNATLTATVNSGGAAPYIIAWTPGGPGSSIVVNPVVTTPYSVTITDFCGTTTTLNTTVNVPVYNPLTVTTTDGSICMNLDGTVSLTAAVTGGAGGYLHSWIVPSGSGASVTVDAQTGTGTIYNPVNGNYIVSVVDQCGTLAHDTASVDLIPCQITIPNVFSPNGDGPNDTFFIINLDYHPSSQVSVFNRWGQLLFHSDDYKNDWKAPDVPDGVYYYVVTLTDGTDPAEYNGFVHILRTK